MKIAIHDLTFNLEYELPLNKRFVTKFKRMFEKEEFVVTDSLPQDNVKIFGKSQPHVVIYMSQGGYIKGRRVMGVTISIGGA